MSGFELPPVAINNTWKKRKGKEEGREKEEIWDLGVFGGGLLFVFINPLQGRESTQHSQSQHISLGEDAASHHYLHAGFGGVPIPGMSYPLEGAQL